MKVRTEIRQFATVEIPDEQINKYFEKWQKGFNTARPIEMFESYAMDRILCRFRQNDPNVTVDYDYSQTRVASAFLED